MQTLNVTYPTIITVLGTVPSYYVQQGDAGYDIFAIGDVIITCQLAGDAESIADFEANYLSKCTPAASKDDAWVLGSAANRVPLVQPRNYDGRPIIQPVTLGSGQWHYWHSVGDDGSTLAGGQRFGSSRDTTGENTVHWSYRDPVWVAGGTLKYLNADLGDWVTLTIYAPATPVVPNPTNTGNCHVVYGVIVPAAGGNTGEYDVDLATAIPVPTSDFEPYSGYWDYTLPAQMMGRGVITPGTPGHAKYHLCAGRVSLDGFVREEMLLGDGESFYEPQNINVSLCLPGWEFECIIHNESGDHNLKVIWRVLVSRYWTTM